MEELWLVCEGGPGSVDASVLTQVFTNVLAAGIVVKSAGGSNPGTIASFLTSQGAGQAAFVVDRDYRPLTRAEESLRDGKTQFIWRRHSIENYLLAPAVMVRAFQRLGARFLRQFAGPAAPPWVAALPTDPDQIADALRACALQRSAEETCRLTVQELWEDLSTTAGRVQKRQPSLPTGREGTDVGAWRDALQLEAQRLCLAATQTTTSPHLEADALQNRFDRIYAGVTAEVYLANLGFLVDFHGRDLLKQFRQWLEQLGVCLNYQRLVRELADAVVEVYAANRQIYGTDDFLDLTNGVRALVGLPALV